MELHFFNPYAEIRHTENRLPHWQQENAVYFITFRLADAIPSHLRNQWESDRATWLRLHPEPWSVEDEFEYHKRFSGAIERWLDAGHGSCLLCRSDCAKIVGETLRHFDGERLALIASVVMPNHVHALLVQGPEQLLEKLIRSWKTFTARQINSTLSRSESLWQRDYFDRIIPNERALWAIRQYILNNPKNWEKDPENVSRN